MEVSAAQLAAGATIIAAVFALAGVLAGAWLNGRYMMQGKRTELYFNSKLTAYNELVEYFGDLYYSDHITNDVIEEFLRRTNRAILMSDGKTTRLLTSYKEELLNYFVRHKSETLNQERFDQLKSDILAAFQRDIQRY